MITVLYVLAAILMLGVMIMIHECGHFWAARLTGIPVREFALGFGPKLLEWKSKKYDTVFMLRLIPAGGYCAFYGEDDPDKAGSSDPKLFNNAKAWKRFVTILMGPVMNFVLALIVAFGFYLVTGEITDAVYGSCAVVSVEKDSPADIGGLKAGDVVTKVNGEDASGLDETGDGYKLMSMISAYREGDDPLVFTVTRSGEEATVTVTPRYNQAEERMMVGVTLQGQAEYVYSPVTVFRAGKLAFDYCAEAGGLILKSLRNLVTRGEGLEDVGGTVRIVQVITEETREYGLEAYISLLIMISVNLGLVNLLPIPGLDGCRLLFLIVEAILRRPINRKLESYIHLTGYGILLVLFLFLTFRDIQNLIS
ncbi:MAG: site-2 protease family protein [Clostridia bacterium]|nr:site-2 protease family protein [Clostridia bacterium]